MSTRFAIAIVLAGLVSSVLFGIGAVTVLSIPGFASQAYILLPIIVVLSFVFAPAISWVIAPKLQARYWRQIKSQGPLLGEPV